MTVDEALSVLGLESDAAPDDIEVAWRELAQMPCRAAYVPHQ